MKKTYDDAIRMATRDSDVEKIADYLWVWSEGGSPTDPLHDIYNKLDKMDKTSKTREEHDAFVKANYKKELDSIYSELKRIVNKKLEDGYKRISRKLENS